MKRIIRPYATNCFLLLLLLVSSIVLAQNSTELESKQGFKGIKILSNISTVKTSDVSRVSGGSRYKYAGDAKTVYSTGIDYIYIETDSSNLIRNIRIFLSPMEDETFFPFSKQLKADFGTPCFNNAQESGNGSLAWKTSKLYMAYIWQYASLGKWKPVLVIGLLQDLPATVRDMYQNPKDDF